MVSPLGESVGEGVSDTVDLGESPPLPLLDLEEEGEAPRENSFLNEVIRMSIFGEDGEAGDDVGDEAAPGPPLPPEDERPDAGARPSRSSRGNREGLSMPTAR